MATDNTVPIDDANFDTEVLGAGQPVLVDFSSQGCGPCQILAPTIAEIAGEYAGRVKVGNVDVGAAPRAATRYGVFAVPTVILFRNGEPVERLSGLRPKTAYIAALDSHVGAK